ncbi:ribosome recycling factor [Syntrophobacter fumaroxidans]|uniref:Ribosome-recycling factor n=1 Tax=Syntrophobacter fumaroxidans (strain DSM 10017 / MPOB) TaxID=335543 RepID=RRF_SYNFM|nr:ribosome recycling factor [Syntrophobacter fumaroxidans]A0LJ66.1 RecName: Full=Ribosome-recycling factor; Short=RRF; AltName: Full=Ribosome-releasing factor [Syntrophobacter fumaroxidans MPOB]ABK17468.1 ribosome recycling factor [Syntrophobacter fumaroxidans MPOB]
MLNDVFADARDRMSKALDNLETDYKRLRTGRASVSLVDGIRAEYYGTPTALNQLATITIPEPRTIMIQPWDTSVIGEIEKSILKSELGLTPMSDGKVIRINIPVLTADRRRELVKVVKKMSEESKVAVRNIRRDVNEMIKDLKKEKEISEDEQFKAQEETQRITDDFIKKIDVVYSAKEKEILEI